MRNQDFIILHNTHMDHKRFQLVAMELCLVQGIHKQKLDSYYGYYRHGARLHIKQRRDSSSYKLSFKKSTQLDFGKEMCSWDFKHSVLTQTIHFHPDRAQPVLHSYFY